jgi:hypothetical protein
LVMVLMTARSEIMCAFSEIVLSKLCPIVWCKSAVRLLAVVVARQVFSV